MLHGFLRTRRGKFTTIDAPGAGTGASQGTETESVNPAGVIQGDYADANGVYHGFLRTPDGTFTTFDAPSGTQASQGIYPSIFSGINPEGASVGEYLDDNWVWHGYIRAPEGGLTEFDDPYAGTGAGSGQGTLTLGVNAAGEISGVYIDVNYAFHGYLRAPDGTITEYDVPGAGTGTYQGTNACWYTFCYGGINPAGTVTGFYVDSTNVYHGFLRSRSGEFVRFNVPGAGKGNWQGTQPASINPEGTITGWYIDANSVSHGFLRLP